MSTFTELTTKSSQVSKQKPKYKSQEKESNTPLKLQSNRLKHLLQATFIGLSNILLQKQMILKFTPFTETPKSLHNIIITQIVNDSHFNESDERMLKEERLKRENFIFCSLCDELQNHLKQIVKQFNRNESYIEKMFSKGRKRSTKNETKAFRKFSEFDPFNNKGIEMFGMKVIEIIVNHPEQEKENERKISLNLQSSNYEIWNAFVDVLKTDDCLNLSGKEILSKYYIETYNQLFSNFDNELMNETNFEISQNEQNCKSNLSEQIDQTNSNILSEQNQSPNSQEQMNLSNCQVNQNIQETNLQYFFCVIQIPNTQYGCVYDINNNYYGLSTCVFNNQFENTQMILYYDMNGDFINYSINSLTNQIIPQNQQKMF